jgi:putative membrane protein insertion efficiency factor
MPNPRNGLTSVERLARQAVLAALRAYKVALSPLFTGSCRFDPSCSTYASEAIAAHGLGRGTWLALKRLARCHPFGSWGHDPVPAPTRVGPRRA